MKITIADHYGMCFGVRDALRAAHQTASAGPATVLGELVHNPVVQAHLKTLGLRQGRLEDPAASSTSRVIITAHGAADRDRTALQSAGFTVTDTTCPLVRKAHTALARLVAAGCHPVVIGQAGHAEVRGLTGDFPSASVILNPDDIAALPVAEKYGVVSQTTQPLALVQALVARLRLARPDAEIRFTDTVCQPTKDRQTALEKLCQENDLIIVVGGRNSNNTRQLVETARRLGVAACQVETADDLCEDWFRGVNRTGVTAGTSTLDETVQSVAEAIRRIAAQQSEEARPLARLAPVIARTIAAVFP